MARSFGYSVFGLGLLANAPVPGLVATASHSRIDVRVWLDAMPPRYQRLCQAAQEPWCTRLDRSESGEPILRLWKCDGGNYFRLLYQDGTEFVVARRGSQVWARWPAPLTVEDTATYLLGPVLGFVLRLRGVVCLHASAVVIDRHVIALLGPAGAGKSTTAAVFARQGYPILSDDVLALRIQGDAFWVSPAYPRLRLWPDSVNFLYGTAQALPRLTPNWEKCYLDVRENGHRFQPQPLPLAAIYLLEKRRTEPMAPWIAGVPAPQCLMSLVANTYANYLLDRAMRAREFEVLGQLAASVPLRRVTPHADPAHLPRLCTAILDDFRSLVPSPGAWTPTPSR
jgi:hypothetical protein